METVHCALCGTTNFKPYQQLNDRFTNDSFTVVKCDNCDHIYLNPRPSEKELGKYYPPEYEPHHSGDTRSAQWHKKRMHKIQLDYVEKFQPAKGCLLDIGCAAGDFMLVAQDNGWQVEGIELSPEAAKFAREKYQLSVITGSAESVPLTPNSYEAITLWDVFEHLSEPRQVLTQCYQALKPNGWLILAIPNLDSFDRRVFGKSWLGWETPRHFNYFNQITLAQILNETGFSLTEGKCLVGGKGVFQVSLQTQFQNQSYWPLIEKVSPLLLSLLWPYRKLSYWRNKGSVITYIAQKCSPKEKSKKIQ